MKNDINENKALSQTSVTSRLCTLKLDYNTKVDLKLSDEGEIKIISTDSYHAGLGYTHKIDIVANEKTSLEKIHIDWRDNLGQIFCSALLDKGVYARVIGENNAYMSKYKIKYSFENPYKEVFDSLKEMVREGRSNFRFSRFVKVEKNNLIVKFVGHEVGGSYTPESKVTPLYIEKIQHKTSKKVEFIERLSGGFGCDIYVFSINLKSSFKPKMETCL
jgi:hypothetical protein